MSFSFVGDNVGGINVTIEDDLDDDSLPEWWEAHWFGNIGQTGSGDFDQDGLSNLQEYNLAEGASGLASLNPADFDSDGDGMDDKWEVDHFADGKGLNPTPTMRSGTSTATACPMSRNTTAWTDFPGSNRTWGRLGGLRRPNDQQRDDQSAGYRYRR